MEGYKYYGDDEKFIPAQRLREDRGLLKYFLLGTVTLGVYNLIFFMEFSYDLNKIATRHDGKTTTNYILMYILGLFSFTIVTTIWLYGVCSRIETELKRREIDYSFGTNDFWGWAVFGGLLIFGNFVYLYKLFKAMNLLCADYNRELDITEAEQIKELNSRPSYKMAN